jgi:hypothetical protein
MADEPERRIVGAIHAELEKQEYDSDLWVGPIESDGMCIVDGPVDLYLLARAILGELEPCTCGRILQQPDHRCLQHPDVRPKTRDEQAAFATQWDAKVAGEVK